MQPKPSLDLRSRIIDAASKLFAEHGYQSVSMRRIADLAGCSQMAMYRHFKDKDDLIRYLCAEAYERFAQRVNRTIAGLAQPRERILHMVKSTITFAAKYPEHYRISMMMPLPSPDAHALREPIAQALLQRLQNDIRSLLPPHTPDPVVSQHLRQVLASIHGMNMMMLANPHTYGLNPKIAITEAQAAVLKLLRK